MRFCSLGSGSAGNCSVVSDGTTTVLVDCGFSAREAERRLSAAGFEPAQVSALLVTHEHSDHVSGIGVFSRKHHVPVYATRGTANAGRLTGRTDGGKRVVADLFTVVAGSPLSVGTLRVLPFELPHDALEPVGYAIEGRCGRRLGLASDLGRATPEVTEALSGCDIVALESNHDVEMLANGPYPAFLKRRIASDFGHLSNVASAASIAALASDALHHVVALHLSETNNTPLHALRALTDSIAALGLKVPVAAATQSAPTAVFEAL